MKNKVLAMILCAFGLALSLNSVYAKSYYCDYEYDGGSVSGEKYDPSESGEDACGMWKRMSQNDVYLDCLAGRKDVQKAYEEGKCKPALKKTHVKGSSKCVVEYYFSDSFTKKKMAVSCSGPETDAIKLQIEKIYK